MSGTGPWARIEHIVVVMFENRSFDNLLGWLYDPANDPPFDKVPADFDGLYGKNLSNRVPGGRDVPAGKTTDPRGPQPNPGEPFEDVYSQVFDVDRFKFEDTPATAPHAANMQGFIRNYAAQEDKPKHPAAIMDSLTPKTLPVLSSLAHYYAVCDSWFASIPTQTFCNRSFVHAGTSSGYVNNGGGGLCFVNDSSTIFDLLEEAGRTWTVFVGGWLLQSFTLLTQKHLWKYALTEHFAHVDRFIEAAAKKGGLPSYSFIEPIYFDSLVWGAENDMHPECNPYEFYGPANLHQGEKLLSRIYEAVRSSPDWESTLLIILFDEHGGCYDHVPPPDGSTCGIAINPDGIIIPQGHPGGIGFNFDRLGPRVPAIIVSAYTPAETRLHQTFDHTSIPRTVMECFELPTGRLGRRVQAARDLRMALKSSLPRQDRPPIAAPRSSVLETLATKLSSFVFGKERQLKKTPATHLQREALHGAALFLQAAELHENAKNLANGLEAERLIARHEEKLHRGNRRG